jgi:hypothetical protein
MNENNLLKIIHHWFCLLEFRNVLSNHSLMQNIYQTFYLFCSISIFIKFDTTTCEDYVFQNKAEGTNYLHFLWSCCEWSYKHEISFKMFLSQCLQGFLDYVEAKLQHVKTLFNFWIASNYCVNHFLFCPCDSWTICTMRVDIVDYQVVTWVTMSICLKAQAISCTS